MSKLNSGKFKGYPSPSSSTNNRGMIAGNSKTCSRNLIIVVVAISTVYLIFNYFNSNKFLGDSSGSSSDQSSGSTYKVKIIPASLDDDALSALPKDTFSYLAMIDAGSSGCRAHVYRYGKLGSADGPLYILPQHVSKKVKPGLSSFAHKPTEAGSSLAGLVEFMKQQVPESDWPVTPIWLKATAGLRMLDESESKAVLASVSDFLSDSGNSPFLFKPSWAKIISGNEEGGFGWIAFNYLKKIIGPKKSAVAESPYAVVEMGGASAQVSQMAPTAKDAEAIPNDYKFSFTIEQDTFHLYTHSYLGFGAEQAREQLNHLLLPSPSPSESTVQDPCLNKGFTRATGVERKEVYEGPSGSNVSITGVATNTDSSIAACSAIVSKVFTPGPRGGSGKCPGARTIRRYLADSAVIPTFDCVRQPAFVAESKNFLIFENFYYTSSAIGVKSVTAAETNSSDKSSFPLLTTPVLLKEAADKQCATEWEKVQTSYPLDSQPKDVNLKLCFVGSYAYSFLVDGLKLSKDKVLTVQREVGSSEIEWALGAAYKETADFLRRANLRQK